MTLPTPYAFLNPKTELTACWIAFAVMILLMKLLNLPSPLFSNSTINTAIQELVTALTAQGGVASGLWPKAEKILAAKRWLQLDCLFALFYTAFFSLACAHLSRQAPGSLALAGVVLSWVSFAGALIDIGENVALWSLLDGAHGRTLFSLLHLLKKAKWVIPSAASAYILICLGYQLKSVTISKH